MPHFIYSNLGVPGFDWQFENLRGIILKKMQKYGIQPSILTAISMHREWLITKEKSKLAADGKLKNDPEWKDYEGSINDDLDSFINNLQYSSEMEDEYVESFFLPKLTKEELKLVEEKNKEHMITYWSEFNG